MKIDSPTFLTETTFISASVQFSSGSQKFGNTSDDTHQFTGSCDFGGNVTLRGDTTVRDNLIPLGMAGNVVPLMSPSEVVHLI